MKRWRRHLRRARFALTALVAVALIAAAVFVGLVQAALPWATHHPEFVARELSARLHRPVAFTDITSEWQPSGPLLTLRGLTLGPGAAGGQSIVLPHAALKFDFGAWLRPAHRWITLRVSSLDLRVVHTTGGWRVDGFGSAGSQAHASLQSLPVDLDLSDLRIDIVDAVGGRAWQLFAPRLRAVNVGSAMEFGGYVQQRGTRQAVTLSGRLDAAARDYDLYLATRDLDLAAASRGLDLRGYTLRSGRGDVELWARWRDGRLASTRVRYALRDVSVHTAGGGNVTLQRFAGILGVTRALAGWDLAWRAPAAARANIDGAGGVLLQLRGHPGAWHVSAAARAVDAAPWLSVLALAQRMPRAYADWLQAAQPQARIDAAALVWHGSGAFRLDARLSQVAAHAAGKVPGLALAQATLRADDQALALELPPQPATVALAYVFRKPYVFRQLAGTLVAWRDAGQWNVATPALHFELGTLVGNAEAQLQWLGHGQPPFLSAYATLARGTAPDAGYFWPYRTMPPQVIAWLNHALVAGNISAGRALVRGPLAAWPFLAHEGRFEAAGHVADATFNFADDWPRATGLDADVDFVDNTMHIVANRAQLRGVAVDRAVADIPDLGNGVLGLDIGGHGSGAALLDFVRHSPVGAGAEDALAGLSVGGSGKLGIQLSIPLDDASKFTLSGRVDLAHAEVSAPKWQLLLKNVSGPLSLQGSGFTASNLSAGFRGAPAHLSLAVAGGVSDPRNVVEASLDATLTPQQLLRETPELALLSAHASGSAPFHIGVTVAAATPTTPVTPTLTVQSSLDGVALDFPAPLDKPAAASWPLTVSLRLPPAGAPLVVSLGEVLQLRGRLADPARQQPAALSVALGGALPEPAPAGGLVVSGHAARLDLDGWIALALAGGSSSRFPSLQHARVSAADTRVFDNRLGSLKIGFQAGQPDDTISFDGAAAKGTVRLPVAGLMTRGVHAQLQHLYWPAAPAATTAAVAAATPPVTTSAVAPTAVPPLHVGVDDLRLGAAHLGKTVLESAPTATGMHVAKFDATGKDFSIRASGDWTGTAAASQTHFVTDIRSRDFGDALAAFGYKGLVAGGRDTQVHLDGTWPGGPSAFSFGWFTGNVKLAVGQGRILAVKPGFGRMLGLLSVRELPSRLALHFGDVFKTGFGFDHVTADLEFRDGSAYTRDMLIKAPSAQIAMQGRVGFRARDFDLTVSAVPHLGATLPVVGAALGGPVGAAAGLVVQGIFGKSINHAADNTYQVTGSWDKPVIVPLVSTPLPAPAGSVAPVPAVPGTAMPAPATSIAVPASAASAGVRD